MSPDTGGGYTDVRSLRRSTGEGDRSGPPKMERGQRWTEYDGGVTPGPRNLKWGGTRLRPTRWLNDTLEPGRRRAKTRVESPRTLSRMSEERRSYREVRGHETVRHPSTSPSISLLSRRINGVIREEQPFGLNLRRRQRSGRTWEGSTYSVDLRFVPLSPRSLPRNPSPF